MAEEAAAAAPPAAEPAPAAAEAKPDVEMAAPAAGEAPAAATEEAAAAGEAAPPAPPAPPAVPEPPKEKEEDAAPDKRPKLKETVEFLTKDTTLNIMPSVHGNVLMALSDGGIQHLLAGARASVGISSGRYMFEVKMVELLQPADTSGQKGGRPPQPTNVLRIGFSTSSSGLVLGSSEDNFFFDVAGSFTHNKTTSKVAEGFGRDNVVAVLLNLDAASPNADTVSLFRDGTRICQPQPIPDALKGKTLFPAVTFRNMTVHVNFGPTPAAPLPFQCRTLQDAAQKDCEVVTEAKPKTGVYDVLYPVCLPDEGTFDWLDAYLEKNPGHIELSDRMILDWADKSGIWRNRGYSWKASNDKPDPQFGVPSLDDGSIKKMLYSMATAQQRNFIVMEVQGNLTKEERQATLKKFSAPHFKQSALVLVGEPTKAIKDKMQALILKDKQEKQDLEWRVKQQEQVNKKRAEKQAKQVAREQKKAEKAKKEAEAAAQKAAAAEGEEKKAEDKAEGEGEEKKAEDAPMEVDAEKKEDEEEDDDEELDAEIKKLVEQSPPPAELTDEERKQFFRKPKQSDILAATLSSAFTTFTLPEKEEGFDDVKYEWYSKTKSAAYLKNWVLNLKLTLRVEDLQPGEWFTKQWSSWQQQLQQWHAKKTEFELAKKNEREAKRRKILEEKAAAEKKEEEKKDAEMKDAEAKEGEAKEGEEAKEAEKKDEPAEEKEEKKAADEPENDGEDDELDVFGVENILDTGKGKPLFEGFTWEDWALLSLRYELYLLVHAFRKDVNDPERPGIHTDHVQFYYNRYFRKSLNTKSYGVETYGELVTFIKDTVSVNKKNSVLEVHVSDELDNFALFLKLTEECRRERRLMLDSGDESCALKFNQQALSAGQGSYGSYGRQNYQRGGWNNDQGGGGKGYTKGQWQSGKDQGKQGGGYQSGGYHGGSSHNKGDSYKGGGGKPAGGSYQAQPQQYQAQAQSQQYGQKRPYQSYGGGQSQGYGGGGGKGGYGR